MHWTVIYRDKDGVSVKESVEAESRPLLFEELKNRGISAISVSERADGAEHLTSLVKGLIAGLVFLILLGSIIVWYKYSRADDDSESLPDVKEFKADKAHKPGAVAAPVVNAEIDRDISAPKKQPTELPPTPKTYRDEMGILRYEGGARVPNQRPTAEPVKVNGNRPEIFHNPAEVQIAAVLQMKLGEPVLGDFRYDERFVASFKKSLEEPIEILETDDEETIALKKDVEETKCEMKARMDVGENVADIMNEIMDEYRRLGAYKHDLLVLRAQYINDTETYSDDDVEEFTKAANEMLKSKGIPPMSMPRALMRGLEEGR